MGTCQAKIEKNLISGAILLGFLCFLVSAIQYEANKSNCQLKERPICLCSQDIEGPVADTSKEVRAHMHNWLISCQGLLCTKGSMMAGKQDLPTGNQPSKTQHMEE